MSHTPGPWWWSKEFYVHGSPYKNLYSEDIGKGILTLVPSKHLIKENTHLIATAPELLYTCLDLLELIDEKQLIKDRSIADMEIIDNAFKVIRKAEGRESND